MGEAPPARRALCALGSRRRRVDVPIPAFYSRQLASNQSIKLGSLWFAEDAGAPLDLWALSGLGHVSSFFLAEREGTPRIFAVRTIGATTRQELVQLRRQGTNWQVVATHALDGEVDSVDASYAVGGWNVVY